MKITKLWQIIFLVLLVIGLDQLVKYVLIVFGLAYEVNEGLFWGAIKNKLLVYFLHLYALLYICKLLIEAFRARKVRNILYLSFIIAGGTGNFLDRIFYGGAIDYIKYSVIPIFNIADISISTGIVFAILNHLFGVKRSI